MCLSIILIVKLRHDYCETALIIVALSFKCSVLFLQYALLLLTSIFLCFSLWFMLWLACALISIPFHLWGMAASSGKTHWFIMHEASWMHVTCTFVYVFIVCFISLSFNDELCACAKLVTFLFFFLLECYKTEQSFQSVSFCDILW